MVKISIIYLLKLLINYSLLFIHFILLYIIFHILNNYNIKFKINKTLFS